MSEIRSMHWKKKFNERAWILRNLKRSELKMNDLKTSYTSLIRPVFYLFLGCRLPFPNDGEQRKQLEHLQARAITIITGNKMSYSSNLDSSDLMSLEIGDSTS